MHEAVERGDIEAIRKLVASGADVNKLSADGCTPLHVAAEKGEVEVVRVLSELGAKMNTQTQVH